MGQIRLLSFLDNKTRFYVNRLFGSSLKICNTSLSYFLNMYSINKHTVNLRKGYFDAFYFNRYKTRHELFLIRMNIYIRLFALLMIMLFLTVQVKSQDCPSTPNTCDNGCGDCWCDSGVEGVLCFAV
jgi:hypothetical protein